MFRESNTIAAISTPPGNASGGLLRLSGDDTRRIVRTICAANADSPAPACRPWRIERCHLSIAPADIRCLAPALLTFFAAPRSYTRQDMAEFLLPGSPPVLEAALRETLLHGARLAEPGEFTFRAFLNGRIDLGQAEAVEKIIHAGSEQERRQGLSRLRSDHAGRIREWRNQLRELSALIEATLDFEEEEIGPVALDAIRSALSAVAEDCRTLAQKAGTDRPQTGGIRVRFLGATNAGKSSLLNRLLGREAAIVSAERSTTRDRIEHAATIGRFTFLLEDGPGADHTLGQNELERGIHARSAAAEDTALALLVIDASSPLSPETTCLLQCAEQQRLLLVLNKTDLPPRTGETNLIALLKENIHVEHLGTVRVSAKQGDGIDKLKDMLQGIALADRELAETSDVTRREADALRQAAAACEAAQQLLAGNEPLELIAEELRAAHEAVSLALGDGYAETVLETIFSRFCIGK